MLATRRKPDDDGGAITVEAAISMIGFLFVFLMALSGITVVTSQLRCIDAAREAARQAARGDVDSAEAAAERIAPGADVDIDVRGDAIEVNVRANDFGPKLFGIRPHGEAYAIREPDR